MSNRPRHPDKDIEAAIAHAEELGWTVKKRTGKTHAWGLLLCPYNDNEIGRASCRERVYVLV